MNAKYIEYKNMFLDLCLELKRAEIGLKYPVGLTPEEANEAYIILQKIAGAILTFCAREAYWFPDNITNGILKDLDITSVLLAKGRHYVEHY